MENPLGTTVVTQIGILCRNIEQTAKAYGEFFGLEYTISQSSDPDEAKTIYNGKSTPARCYQAFFQLGDVQIELIQPDEHPSVWRDDLEQKGEGLHHLAFWVKDTDGVLRKLSDANMPVRMTGCWETGRYAYVNAFEKLKIVLETLENT